MKCFYLYDVKANEYLFPFESASIVTAQRACIDLLLRNPENNRFLRHISDYVLCHAPSFDPVSGTFENVGPEVVSTLSAVYESFVASQKVNQ